MPTKPSKTRPPAEDDLVARAQNRDAAAVRAISAPEQPAAFRVAGAIVRDDNVAEDTWLTRIVINEACGRLRRRHGVAQGQPTMPRLRKI
jgi:RNA polymerase sigma-70 factor (ECF subfamily)